MPGRRNARVRSSREWKDEQADIQTERRTDRQTDTHTDSEVSHLHQTTNSFEQFFFFANTLVCSTIEKKHWNLI